MKSCIKNYLTAVLEECQESLNTCDGKFLLTCQNSKFYQDPTHQNFKIYPREEGTQEVVQNDGKFVS
jgi:hypothetical protein